MKKFWPAAVFSVFVLVGFGDLLLACGVKFMIPSIGSRLQRPRNAAAILIYDSGEQLRKGLASSPEKVFREAGFRPTMVTTLAELEQKAKSDKWDAILIGAADAESVRSLVDAPLFVPVVLDATDAQVKELRSRFPVVLRLPAKTNAFMSAVDKALEYKPAKTSPKTLTGALQ